MLRIRIRADVYPTEDPDRVRRAVLHVFPDAEVRSTDRAIEATTSSLARLAELVRDHQIPDTARGILLRGRRGSGTRFLLGKQAAFVGRPNLGVEPGPLGEIEVEVDATDERALLYAIYEVGFDTTVPPALARIPREFRDQSGQSPNAET